MTSPRRTGEFLHGVRLLWRGAALFARTPGLLVLGMIPALISLIVIATALAALLYSIGDLAELVTWFAADWSPTARTAIRSAAGIAIVGLALLLAVLTFTALTLLIGEPFYEVISNRVEQRAGGAPPEGDLPWYVALRRSVVDSVKLLGFSLAVGVPLTIAGFVPLIGQTVVPVVSATLASWIIALELTSYPFERRGLRLADRRRLLRAHRQLALGFGLPVFGLMLVPFVGIAVMPVAVAGGTLLARHVLAHPVGFPPAAGSAHRVGFPPAAGSAHQGGSPYSAGSAHRVGSADPAIGAALRPSTSGAVDSPGPQPVQQADLP